MIELCSVSVGYGQKTVLREASASFAAGRLTSVIGVNGSGKSTLMKAMLGILPLTGGEIRLDGADIRTMQRNELAKRIAYLSQSKSIPDMTVGQMVLCGRFPYLSYPRRYRESDRAAARAAMERVGILHLADQPLYALSGGMRQIAYIAMALAQETDYILLDEPTTYLDIAHRLELMRLLKTLSESGKGIVAVMHDLSLAFDFSDEIAVLQNGGIAARATPSMLCASPVIREIFGVSVEKTEEERYVYRYPRI